MREQDDEEAKQKRVRFVDGEQVSDDDGQDGDPEDGEDSDELCYDSEEEDELDRQYAERMALQAA